MYIIKQMFFCVWLEANTRTYMYKCGALRNVTLDPFHTARCIPHRKPALTASVFVFHWKRPQKQFTNEENVFSEISLTLSAWDTRAHIKSSNELFTKWKKKNSVLCLHQFSSLRFLAWKSTFHLCARFSCRVQYISASSSLSIANHRVITQQNTPLAFYRASSILGRERSATRGSNEAVIYLSRCMHHSAHVDAVVVIASVMHCVFIHFWLCVIREIVRRRRCHHAFSCCELCV